MSDVPLSRIAGSNSLPELAQDLNFVSSLDSTGSPYKQITVNAVGSLTSALSLTGKFALSFIGLANLTINDLSRVKLTIDGEVKIDSTLTGNQATAIIIGSLSSFILSETYTCKESLLLEIQTIANTNAVRYLVRPIL